MVEMHMNNVRFSISNGLQHFEDNGSPAFDVSVSLDSEPDVHSMYANNLWIAGTDGGGNLRLAGGTYRTNGETDFYPGPLSNDNFASTDADICAQYDKVYLVNKTDVLRHHEYFTRVDQVSGGADPAILSEPPFENGYQIPESITNWAGNNFNPNYSFFLAPFYDWNNDGLYHPEDGDYPWFDLNGQFDCQNFNSTDNLPLLGHQAAWYVCNDNGGPHGETGGEPIGLEIQVMPYTYADCGAIDNTVFTRYTIINRGTFTLQDTRIGNWADPDLGCPSDDYVGCDVSRGMGYVINGDLIDESCIGLDGYGEFPPAIGIDLLSGPYQDADGIDNPLSGNLGEANQNLGIHYAGQGSGYSDDIIDNERMGMGKFMYHRSTPSTGPPLFNGPPQTTAHYYHYLHGKQFDGSSFTYGGNGETGTINCDYMFPGESDPLGSSTNGQVTNGNWSELLENFPAGRRMFVMSAGDFTLEPGEINHLTTAHIWARDESSSDGSLLALQEADDEIQAHFDNCFALVSEYPLLNSFELVLDGNQVTLALPVYSASEVVWDFGNGSSITYLTALMSLAIMLSRPLSSNVVKLIRLVKKFISPLPSFIRS
jgi:hypothetical protein